MRARRLYAKRHTAHVAAREFNRLLIKFLSPSERDAAAPDVASERAAYFGVGKKATVY